MLISIIISGIGLLFLLVNAILFFKTRKGKDNSYQYLTFYFSILFIIEFVCHLIGITKPNSNFFLSHYYFLIQFLVLSLFFYQMFQEKSIKQFIAFNLLIVLVILGLQYFHNPELYWKFNVLEIGVTSTILISYCIIHFYKHLKTTYKYFFFCFGLTFYLMSSMLIFITGNTTLVFFEEPFYLDIWFFNSIFYIFYQYLIFKEWKNLNRKSLKK